MNCPKCQSSETWRDEVDVGVGTIYGPWRCDECMWREEDSTSEELSQLLKSDELGI